VQLATTEDEEGVIGGQATFGAESSAVVGQRTGSTVDMTFNLDGQAITFNGKLKTKNNKLKGAFESEGDSSKATFVPADGNGKPMKFKKVQRLAAVELEPGQSRTVRIQGKNIALGAMAFTDLGDVQVAAVELESAKSLSVTVTTSATAAEGTAVALRLFNGDGETADKANALSVAGDGGGEDPVDFELQIQPIFTSNCATSGCHAASAAKAGLVARQPGQRSQQSTAGPAPGRRGQSRRQLPRAQDLGQRGDQRSTDAQESSSSAAGGDRPDSALDHTGRQRGAATTAIASVQRAQV